MLQAQEYGTYPVCENMSVLSASSKEKKEGSDKSPGGMDHFKRKVGYGKCERSQTSFTSRAESNVWG